MQIEKDNIRTSFGKHRIKNSPIFIFGLIIIFWTMFDGIMQYITPILLEEN